ncbi:MAG: hypothetical protein QME78_05225 [Thermodesulfobacteriota bacterium]|nr:hypothetical protein [Thermodesulfobacteriota bacterium]
MPAYAGIQFLDSGFRRNDDASIGVLNPIAKIKSSRKKVFSLLKFSLIIDH